MKDKFPIFQNRREGKELIYLDSAATAHKPLCVIESISNFYKERYGSVDRGLYDLAYQATASVEGVRGKVAGFIHCEEKEVVFTHSATESLNLIAYTYGEQHVEEGDDVLVSILEHHSNYLPWKMLCERKKANFITFDICDDGTIDLEDFKSKITRKTKIVAISHQSNVLGIKNPVKEICRIAHEHGAVVVVDGAQMVAHESVNVKDIDADFYVFSAHKMYGPTGVGVLYGKYSLLQSMPPFHVGGGMVENIGTEITYRDAPHKFEAGTPMIASIIGLGAAIEFLQEIGMNDIAKKEKELSFLFYDALKNEVEFLSSLMRGASILTFTINGLHPTDVSMLLSLENVSLRAGNMCAQPLLHRLKKSSVLRISLGIYTDKNDLTSLLSVLSSLKQER